METRKRTPNTWQRPQVSDPLVGRYGHSAVVHDKYLYVFAGFNLNGTLNDMHKYSFETNSWTKVTGDGIPPHPRFFHSAVVFARRMFVFGGHSGHGGTYFNDVHVFSFDDNHWDALETSGDIPAGRRSQIAVVHDDGGDDVSLRDRGESSFGSEPTSMLRFGNTCMYVFGGFYNNVHSNELFKLSLSTGRWSLVGTTGEVPSLKSHTAVVLDHAMYVFGGRSQRTFYNDVFKYSFQTAAWTRLNVVGDKPDIRYGHSAVLEGEDMYLYGGCSDTRPHGDAWRLHLRPSLTDSTFRWTCIKAGGEQPAARFFHSAVTFDHMMVIFGGYSEDAETRKKTFRDEILFLHYDPIIVPSSSLVSDLRGMLFEDEFADVTFKIGDKVLRAHKAILCARSDTFQRMFRSKMRESLSNEVSITTISYPAFLCLMEYLYTDTLNLSNGCDVLEVLPLADLYALPRLKALCMDSIREGVTIENVISLLLMADLHSAHGLKALCIDFIVSNLSAVRTSGTLGELRKNADLLFEVMQHIADCQSTSDSQGVYM